MRIDQWLSLLIIALMMGAFVWGRYRYDVVAVSSEFLRSTATTISVPWDAIFADGFDGAAQARE